MQTPIIMMVLTQTALFKNERLNDDGDILRNISSFFFVVLKYK